MKKKKRASTTFVMPQIDCTQHQPFFALFHEDHVEVAEALAYLRSPDQKIDEVFVLRALLSCFNLLDSSKKTELFSFLLEQEVDWALVFDTKLFCALKEIDSKLKKSYCNFTSILQIAILKRQTHFAIELIKKGASINDNVAGTAEYNNTLRLLVKESEEEEGARIFDELIKRNTELKAAGLKNKTFSDDVIQDALESIVQLGYPDYLNKLLQHIKGFNPKELIQVLSLQVSNFFNEIYFSYTHSEDAIAEILSEEAQKDIRDIYKSVLAFAMQALSDFSNKKSKVSDGIRQCLSTLKEELEDYVKDLSAIKEGEVKSLEQLEILFDFYEQQDEEVDKEVDEPPDLLRALMAENSRLLEPLLTFYTEFLHDVQRELAKLALHDLGLSDSDSQPCKQSQEVKKPKKKKKRKGKKATPASSACAQEEEESTSEEEEDRELAQQEQKLESKREHQVPTSMPIPTRGKVLTPERSLRQESVKKSKEKKQTEKPKSYKTEEPYDESLHQTSSTPSFRRRRGTTSTRVTSSTPTPETVSVVEQAVPLVSDRKQFPPLPLPQRRNSTAVIASSLSTQVTTAQRGESPVSLGESDSSVLSVANSHTTETTATPVSSLASVLPLSPPPLSPSPVVSLPASAPAVPAPKLPAVARASVGRRQEALKAPPPVGLYVPVVERVDQGVYVTTTRVVTEQTTFFFPKSNRQPGVVDRRELVTGVPIVSNVTEGVQVQRGLATEMPPSTAGALLIDRGIGVFVSDYRYSENFNKKAR